MTSSTAGSLQHLFANVISALTDNEPWWYAIDLDESNLNSLASLLGHPNESLREILGVTGLMEKDTQKLLVCQPIPLLK
jgi:hypothetical protein